MTGETDDCRRCGTCCRRWGTSLAGTVDDLYRWLEEGRYDILQYCSARMNDGSVICGAELDVTDLGDVYVVDLWKAPDGSSLTACPFLSFDNAGLSLCTIHADKPSVCRRFTPYSWDNYETILDCPAHQEKKRRHGEP
jgi:Fe-S-cluster containining protein